MSLLRGFTGIAFLAVWGCSSTTVNNYGTPAGGGGKDAGNGGSVAASGGSVATGGQGSGGAIGAGSGDAGPEAATGGQIGTGGAGTGGETVDGNPCSAGQKWCLGGCVQASDPNYGCGFTGCDPCNYPSWITGIASPTCSSQQCVNNCTPDYHWDPVAPGGATCVLNDCPAGQVRCGVSSDGGPKACVPWDQSNACGLMWPTGGPICVAANPAVCQCCRGQGMCGMPGDGGCQ